MGRMIECTPLKTKGTEKRTRYRRICCTWIFTVLRDSLRSFPSSTTGGPVTAVAMTVIYAVEATRRVGVGDRSVIAVDRSEAM